MSEPRHETRQEEFPNSAEQARLDLELTRRELGDTVQALQHRLNVPARLAEYTDGGTALAREKVPTPVVDGAEQLLDQFRRNPAPAVGGGVALLLVALITKRALGGRDKH